jgi:hypothetical protein
LILSQQPCAIPDIYLAWLKPIEKHGIVLISDKTANIADEDVSFVVRYVPNNLTARKQSV